jgi:hypothetical protein
MSKDWNLICVVCSLWGCHLVGVILFMWDIRVVEKCVGDFFSAVTLVTLYSFPSGLLWVSLAGISLFFFFFLFRCSFCILSMYLGAPYAFYNVCGLPIKKINRKQLTSLYFWRISCVFLEIMNGGIKMEVHKSGHMICSDVEV